jgi:ABC-type transporter Mla subunit MlaD
MTNFTDLRNQLAGTRTQAESTASRLAIAREQLKDVQSEVAALQRTANAQTDPGGRRLAQLTKQAADLNRQIDGLRSDLGRLKAQNGDLLVSLSAMNPEQQIEELNDHLPILLFPVRLETRFHAPSAANLRANVAGVATAPQLWIRVYPDDCQIDSFEELLTKTELENAREFWASMWRAGGVEAQERGAWRSLVAGSGSGRAAYVISQYAPNVAEKPVKIDPQDIVLVIIPEIDVTPFE